MRRVRQFIGPLIVGLAAYFASGDITVPNGSAAIRFAVPAPFWILMVATAIAALVRPWRDEPLLTAPALLTVLPWCPIPLPAVALMWTGALAWVPIALALLATLFAARSFPTLAVSMTPVRQAVAAGVISLVLSIGVAWSAAPELPGGDEPHYLVITQSLLKDGDLRIENNHTRRDYAEYYEGTLAPDMLRRGKDGQIYSIHAPGVPVLVLPAFRFFGYRGAQATVMIAAAMAAVLMWLSVWRATASFGAAWFAWAAIAFSTTYLIQSVMIFPDGPGLLCVAAAVWLIVKLDDADAEPIGMAAIAAVSAGLAALPWLHTRFAILAGALGGVIVFRLVALARLGARGSGLGGGNAREAWRRVLTFAAVPAVSAMGWFAFFQIIYGTPNPSAPYGIQSDVSWRFIPGAMLGLLVDQQYGLLTYAPALAAAFIGLAGRGDRASRSSRQLMAVAGVYAAAVGLYWMWWAGQPATPARFLTAALPLAAVALGRAWSRADRVARWGWLVALAATAAISAITVGVDRAAAAWNVRDAIARWLEWPGSVVSPARGAPSFFRSLTPGVASSEWPFFLHAASGGAMLILAVAAGVASARRASTRAGSAVLVTGSAAVGVMLFVQAGLTLDRVDGLDPLRSQIAVLDDSRDRSLWSIIPWSISRAPVNMAVALRPNRDRLAEFADAGATIPDLPGGHYEIRGTSRRPVGGTLAIRVGTSPAPLQQIAWPALSEHSTAVVLASDVRELSIEPDAALQAAGIAFTVTAVGPRWRRTPPARAADGGGVWFLDDHVFIESDGFWVRGGGDARLVLTRTDGARVAHLTLGNGGTSNNIEVSGLVDQRFSLGPGEIRDVDIPLGPSGPVNSAEVRITSPAGFRPSDAGASGDHRYLGVRVVVHK